jgi:hypothetical protein
MLIGVCPDGCCFGKITDFEVELREDGDALVVAPIIAGGSFVNFW